MSKREEKRDLQSIPVGSLGMIPLQSCSEMGTNTARFYWMLRSLKISGSVSCEPLGRA